MTPDELKQVNEITNCLTTANPTAERAEKMIDYAYWLAMGLQFGNADFTTQIANAKKALDNLPKD